MQHSSRKAFRMFPRVWNASRNCRESSGSVKAYLKERRLYVNEPVQGEEDG